MHCHRRGLLQWSGLTAPRLYQFHFTSDSNAFPKLLITPWGFISTRCRFKRQQMCAQNVQIGFCCWCSWAFEMYFYANRSWGSSNKSATSKCKTVRGLISHLLRYLRSHFLCSRGHCDVQIGVLGGWELWEEGGRRKHISIDKPPAFTSMGALLPARFIFNTHPI